MDAKHCVNLEIAKELKEANWNKETEFWWGRLIPISESFKKMYEGYPPKWELRDLFLPVFKEYDWELRPAPFAEEILEDLPSYINEHGRLTIWKFDSIYQVAYDDPVRQSYRISSKDESLPDALAKMWIYLKKEKLL